MSLLKIVIGVFAIIIFTKIGVNKSKIYEQNYRYYNALCIFCTNLLGELKYSKKELKTFENKEYFSADFSSTLSTFLNEGKDKIIFYPSYLNEVEKSKITTFFEIVGKGDSLSQQGVVNGFLDDFNVLKNEKYQTFNKYKSFYKKLGFYVGLIMLIMVV